MRVVGEQSVFHGGQGSEFGETAHKPCQWGFDFQVSFRRVNFNFDEVGHAFLCQGEYSSAAGSGGVGGCVV